MSWSLLLAFVVVVGIFIILFDSGFYESRLLILFYFDTILFVMFVVCMSECPSV